MRFRIAWTTCPDCGRSSEMPGGCFVVERRGWFWWYSWITTYDRDGSRMAYHHRTIEQADEALRRSLAKKSKSFVVMREFHW